MQDFGSIPYEVVLEKQNYFPAGRTTGVSIAAIKCLLVFGLYNDFRTKEVSLSLSQIEDVTGCSKPMVIEGIKQLCSCGIVTKVDQGKTNVKGKYIINFPSKRFTQIPHYFLCYELRNFPNKGITALVALKAYLILLKFRRNDTSHTEITYTGFARYGINLRHLNKALAILISSNYISIFKQYNWDEKGYNKSCNNYKILRFPTTFTIYNKVDAIDFDSVLEDGAT